MTWNSLAEINSVDPGDMDEYHSRPDDRVKQFISERQGDVVVYGARGKFSRHVSLMLLRAVQETGTTSRTVHLISSPREDRGFDRSVQPYGGFAKQYHIDLMNATEAHLQSIPDDASLMFYLAGYKFAKPGEGDRDYALKCDLYGMVIPSLVFTHHQEYSDIVIMGSYNGSRKTPVSKPAGDDAPLCPSTENHYGRSILNKEHVVHAILEGRKHEKPSSAVILRGGYYTDASTYGGFEPEILKIMNGQKIDLAEKAYFNLISNRDAAIATLLAPRLAAATVSTFNLSGPVVDVREAAEAIAVELRQYPGYSEVEAKITGSPADVHLLADGSALEERLGKPVDPLDHIIHAHVYWIVNGGHVRGIDHKTGENL